MHRWSVSKTKLKDQAGKGQVLKFTEVARARFRDVVVGLLGAQRKEKPNGVVSARVLFRNSCPSCQYPNADP